MHHERNLSNIKIIWNYHVNHITWLNIIFTSIYNQLTIKSLVFEIDLILLGEYFKIHKISLPCLLSLGGGGFAVAQW